MNKSFMWDISSITDIDRRDKQIFGTIADKRTGKFSVAKKNYLYLTL